MTRAEIITIGDEILIGQIIDTNSAWIAEQLNAVGIQVYQITSISDNAEHIAKALDEASQQVDIIVITGGLGPTKDDITKHTLAKYFGAKKMVIYQPALDYITALFTKRGMAVTELNRKQAEVPDIAKAISNPCGTAPAMCFEKGGKIYVSMPGVPSEMKAILPEAIQLICGKINSSAIYHKSMLTYGIPESMLAEKIEDWEDALPKHIKLAYLPSAGTGVKLRLSANGVEDSQLKTEVNYEFSKLIPLLGNAIYGYEPDNLASVIGKMLLAQKSSLGTAESCTGGRIAHLITSNAGSSEYFKGGIVSYSNEAKINILGVDKSVIDKYGAVSKETVEQMAQGARKVLNVDYAIATSGIAGPLGGTEDKPVGLCWFAIAGHDKTFTVSSIFTTNRSENILRASANALNLLRLFLLEEEK